MKDNAYIEMRSQLSKAIAYGLANGADEEEIADCFEEALVEEVAPEAEVDQRGRRPKPTKERT